MPTLEFKPRGIEFQYGTTRFKTVAGLNATQMEPWNADDIIFTASRNNLPPQLLNHVPAALWEETFDLVKARLAHKLKLQQEVVAATNELNRSSFCVKLCTPTAGLAILRKEEQDNTDLQQEWLALVQTEQAKYSDHGIHVSLLPEISFHGRRNRVRQIKVNVGLKFEIQDPGSKR